MGERAGRTARAKCNTLQHTATHCNTLQHTTEQAGQRVHTATHCNTLQHTATHYRAGRTARAKCRQRIRHLLRASIAQLKLVCDMPKMTLGGAIGVVGVGLSVFLVFFGYTSPTLNMFSHNSNTNMAFELWENKHKNSI